MKNEGKVVFYKYKNNGSLIFEYLCYRKCRELEDIFKVFLSQVIEELSLLVSVYKVLWTLKSYSLLDFYECQLY